MRLDISQNEGLDSLHGLDKLQSIGSTFYFQNNDQIKNLKGLGRLQYVGGDLYIEDCDQLRSLAGIEKLDRVGRSLYIQFNPVLHDIFSVSPELFVEDYWVMSALRCGGGISGKDPSMRQWTGLHRGGRFGNSMWPGFRKNTSQTSGTTVIVA
jgi:hypothetical protein